MEGHEIEIEKGGGCGRTVEGATPYPPGAEAASDEGKEEG